MFNASVLGENLQPADVTSINVAGKISYSPSAPSLNCLNHRGADRFYSRLDAIFSFMIDPNATLQIPLMSSSYASAADRLCLFASETGSA